MRSLWYDFKFRDCHSEFSGRGRIYVDWGLDYEVARKHARELIKEAGYCIDFYSNKQFRWYNCHITFEA